MTQKLVLFDVDDTIIDHSQSKSEIPQATIKAIKELQEKGHVVGLATGRSYAHIHHIMDILHMDTAVCFGGHLVLHENKEIFREYLDWPEVSMLLKDIFKTIYPAVTITEDKIYVKDFFGRVKKALYHEANTLEGEALLTDITPFTKLDVKPRKYLSMMIFKKALKNQEKYTKLDFNAWGDKGFEVYAKGVSKLSGILVLAKKLNISEDDIIVFGDNYNDLHMLKYIKHSVAVGNGVKAAKDAASYVCPPIYEEGILKACYHLDLLEENNG